MATVIETEEAKSDLAMELGAIPQEEISLDEQLVNFRLLAENAIPIPPTTGERFAEFFEDNLKRMKEFHIRWKAAIEAYNLTGSYEQTNKGEVPQENFVRIVVESLIDFTYMRNPQGEFTSTDPEGKDLANVVTKAVTALVNKRAFPGLNLKPKLEKQIMFAHLTNLGLLKLEYQSPKGSIEEVLEVLEKTRVKIKEENDPEKAGKLYALLDILQRELEVRRHSGISLRFVSPFAMVVGPEADDYDFSSSQLLMERELIREDFIKAEYMIFNEEDNSYKYRYDQNTLLATTAENKNVTAASTAEQILNDLLPDMDDLQKQTIAKGKVPCVWVYDRTTRLKYLYIEGNWQTPLWVYEDEMLLSRFFPFFALGFTRPLQSIIQDGEVSRYIAHQHQLNNINVEIAAVRRAAFNTFLYDSSAIDRIEVEKIFKEIDTPSRQKKAIGVKLKDNEKGLDQILVPLKMPFAQFTEIFNKDELLKSLDRASRISDAQKGAEFRTNTTNKAIDTYNEYASNRIEGLTDRIEDNVESVFWSIAELVVSKFDDKAIAKLLNLDDAAKFKPMSVEDFNSRYNLVVASGSTEKPTSMAKKKEASQIIQMLGQFGTAAPRTVLSVVAKLLRAAFSRSLVTDKDLEMLEKEGAANMQKGISAPQAQQPT